MTPIKETNKLDNKSNDKSMPSEASLSVSEDEGKDQMKDINQKKKKKIEPLEAKNFSKLRR